AGQVVGGGIVVDLGRHLNAIVSLDVAATARVFGERLPILPLMFRAVRIWYRTDVRGLGFDALGRVGFANLSLFGDPVKAKRSP
ncbi:MAG: hypothetical protein NT062_35530, partial [Proteobacteria bacterium]|nr:hypothetical protein [Pseudomonadota bacterium]